MIDSLANKMKVFQEQWDQRSKQQEGKIQYSREMYHDKQHKIIICSAMLDQYYPKQEPMKTSEAMDTPYNQRSEKKS